MRKYYFSARDAARYLKCSEKQLSRFRRPPFSLPFIKRRRRFFYEYGPWLLALRRKIRRHARHRVRSIQYVVVIRLPSAFGRKWSRRG
jgi:hypothetical protein